LTENRENQSMSLPFGWMTQAVRKAAFGAAKQAVSVVQNFVRKHPALKRALRPLIPYIARPLSRIRAQPFTQRDYRKWIAENDRLTPADEQAIRVDIARFSHRPLLSIIMATYETPEAYLRAAIASVQAQIYDHWELCIADDASTLPYVATILRQAAAADPRIRVASRTVRGHMSVASNTALELARGEWVVLMDHDDLIPPDALYELVAEMNDRPDAQIIYTDEDKIDGHNQRYSPYFKPDFDPDLLLGQNLLNHLTAYRRGLVLSVGGFREGFEGAQDHDLALRATAACGPDAVRHIPRVLYHWRQLKTSGNFSQTLREQCVSSARRAVAEHLESRGIPARIVPLAPVGHRIMFPLPKSAPLVSILIPTRNRADLLRVCLDGILNKTDYPALEVLVADNGSTEPDALDLLRDVQADPRVRILDLPGPFNFAGITNTAASEAQGDILLLLNNDIEVIRGDWLKEMVTLAVRSDVGAVGCRLLYPNGRLQHGGTVLGIGGVADHLMVGAHRNDTGPFGVLKLLRSAGAVTAACLALRREVWEAVGGMDDINLAVAFNDVDLCLKIRQLGLRVVWTPFAELYHHESASRGSDLSPEKARRFRQEIDHITRRWDDVLLNDPYYNPNFSLDNASFVLAPSPRRKRRYHAAPSDNAQTT
jgi:glycosyltransferase involved in cell wall biosynthesis